MKLTFKDLKQQKFTIDAESSETLGKEAWTDRPLKIGAIKEKIAAEKGWEASQQKLIYSGKILQDANTVESYKIEEKGFIVCMLQKPKAPPASASTPAAPSTPAPAVTQTPAAPPAAPATSSNTAPPETPTPAATNASTQEASFTDPSTLALGSERNAAIENMENMGFERSQIDRAMRAAFNNPDRAVEYLLNGIPTNIQQEQTQASAQPAAARAAPSQPQPVTAPATQPAQGGSTGGEGEDEPINLFEAAAQAGRGGAPGRGQTAPRAGGPGNLPNLDDTPVQAGPGGTPNLDFLRNNPQFQQLRQIVQTQPRMLEPILQQVGAGNPHLAQLIGQNPDQFLQLLAEDADEDDAVPPGAIQISINAEEQAAIERLCSLGFERDMAIQAYFACDKNEDAAANFLFDNAQDDDDQ